ncbi:golgin subfamily A member 5 [Nitzschia inconspicua]|uniref:Golgin subfamily A member 5 n=1 Tax=Nitzschia inconspicua TaxID=303405 RepID=A0A9K3KSR9_9STRA|nr:golgin subfamily A member 5 [Nitzschia inconspicua]
MSRWLSSVNNLLEKLDDRVETVVEERAALSQVNDDADDLGGRGGGIDNKTASLENILVKRGLSAVDSKDEEQEEDHGTTTEDELPPAVEVEPEGSEATCSNPEIINEPTVESMGYTENTTIVEVAPASEASLSGENNTNERQSSLEGKESVPVTEKLQDTSSEDPENETNTVHESHTENSRPAILAANTQSMTFPPTQPSNVSTPTKKLVRPTTGTPTRTQKERELIMEMKEAQKEARTLRRHVVSLNEQLEAAESELQAQRKELERAAERMEKDRLRSKQEKESFQKRQAQEISLLKDQNEKTLKDQQRRFEEQIEGYRKRLLEEENKRKQEGGDWNKEISQAIDREQEMRLRASALEDEKLILLSRISTLEGQQMALGSQLESLTQAADNAIEREREAEDRLDLLLNQHARQISQRQAREAELEQTIQDLNAALVASRNGGVSAGMVSNLDGSSQIGNTKDSSVKVLEMELETANSHLALERERIETLQIQLRDLSKETAQEATNVQQKQLQAERKIADMSLTISKLEARLREEKKKDLEASASSERTVEKVEMANQIQLLSEEVVRLRDKIADHNSESLAMKHRLKSAVDRATKLEDELALARNSQSDNADIYDSMERAQSSRRRRLGTTPSVGSIRSAMRLDGGGGERSKQIGQAIDAVDSFAVSTGKYLRRNPLARAAFIFYLIVIHLWSFIILFFHAHSFQEHGDFGAGVGAPHGPHALMMDHNVVKPVLVKVADASGEILPENLPHINEAMEAERKEGDTTVAKLEKESSGENH